ncbi:MOSC domain-containing protein [Nocardioides gilvus]|uniref:MOSC domain-containing protein n=1 Tax=Nocardioides gilvus TaxID=1735589 RepID=UPI000D740E0F|nr:MOSC N-terminal beta barrel domain-containing protein [Nocardioides gilvus]
MSPAAPEPLLTGLHIHPVKSMAIRTLSRSAVLARGLQDDRSWVVVDSEGDLVSAREFPALFSVEADTPITSPGLQAPLRLRSSGRPDLLVEIPNAPRSSVTMFGQALAGTEAAPEVQQWLRTTLGRSDLRLLWCHDPQGRSLNPTYAAPQDHTAYADGYPLTLATDSSLAQLNEWITQGAIERGEPTPAPLGMERFRPNLVVSGTSPFEEELWQRVRIGDVSFRVTHPSGRCVMTTVDPRTLERGKEPIRTLARHRRSGSKVIFAMNLIPEGEGILTLGDAVVPERA